jgi:hypothetical protein
MPKVKVEKIRITIGRKVLELSPDELQELREVLDAAFPVTTKYVPSHPIVIERPTWPRPFIHWQATLDKTSVSVRNGHTLCLNTTRSA